MVPDFLLQASGANLLASQNKLLAPDSLFVLSRLNLSPHPFFIASGLVFVNLSVPFSLSDSDKEILVGVSVTKGNVGNPLLFLSSSPTSSALGVAMHTGRAKCKV